MGVSTRAYLQGKIEPEKVAQFVQSYLNIPIKNIAILNSQCSPIKMKQEFNPVNIYSDNKTIWIVENCHICFKNSQNKTRIIFWYVSNTVFDNDEDFRKKSTEPFTYISMTKDEESIALIKSLTTHFGGYFDEDDCDDIDYIAIPKNSSEVKNGGLNSEIKPIFYFTMEELQEYFGGFVKIVSNEEKEKLVEKKITMKKMTPPSPPEAPPLRTLTEGFKRNNN